MAAFARCFSGCLKSHFSTVKLKSRFLCNFIRLGQSRLLNTERVNLISDLLIQNPKLCVYDNLKMNRFLDMFLAFGFEELDIKSMIEKCPQLLTHDPSSHAQLLNSLNMLTIKQGILIEHLAKNPHLFLLNVDGFHSRCSELLSVFPNKDLRVLFLDSPNVFYEEWKSIIDKVNYICLEIGLEQKDAVYSSALSFSLEYIKCRHLLLVRTGKFKKLHPKTRHLSKNIRLREMLNYTNLQLVHYAGVTLEEYYFLTQIIEAEEPVVEDEDSDLELD